MVKRGWTKKKANWILRIILFRHKTTLANKSFSSESSGFSLGLEKGEDVSLSNGALHVPDDLKEKLWNFKDQCSLILYKNSHYERLENYLSLHNYDGHHKIFYDGARKVAS